MSILQGREYRKRRGGQSIGVGGRRRPLSKGGRLGENREGELLRREKTPTKGEFLSSLLRLLQWNMMI